MYLAMNRFKVKKDRTDDFEQLWLTRESDLHTMQGFVEFRLLKGQEQDDHTLYSSHTFWKSEEDFTTWTKSKAFAKAHSQARSGNSEPMTLGHPVFEGFNTIQTISMTA